MVHGTCSSFVFAFLPLGSPSTATNHAIRLGHCRTHDSKGVPTDLHFRFHGLNKCREMLLQVEVDDEPTTAVEEVKDFMRGHKGKIGSINIETHETFKQAFSLGTNWFYSSLPLADIRAVFYSIARVFSARIDGTEDLLRSDQTVMMTADIWPEATAAGTEQTLAN